MVFADEYSDVAVFELLQDIPPEWGAVMAGEVEGARRGHCAGSGPIGVGKGEPPCLGLYV